MGIGKTVDGVDVNDGSFSMEVTPPVATPQAYKVAADVADEEWASTTYTVLDKNAVNTNKTLNDILAALQGLNIPALTTKIDDAAAKANAAATAATAAGTKADAATAAANAAKASADAATAAAGTASTKSDAATTAANAAKASADAAAAASQGLTTLVYVAIAAAVVAALAAIYAVMQITKKIA
jgi:hypothetical protein